MNLNPFDLRGPEFLVFYLILSAGTLVLVWMFRRWKELGEDGSAASAAKEVAQDPYQVAYLRGGRDEVVRVAVVSLIERGLLEARGESRAGDPGHRLPLAVCRREDCRGAVARAHEYPVCRQPFRALRTGDNRSSSTRPPAS
jgi:uncharacterized protein (TIGR04222 family)